MLKETPMSTDSGASWGKLIFSCIGVSNSIFTLFYKKNKCKIDVSISCIVSIMRQIQYFFLPDSLDPRKKGSLIKIQERDVVHQLANVLRMKLNEECYLLDNHGNKLRTKIIDISKKCVSFEVIDCAVCPADKNFLRLCVAIPKKPSTLELIVQKATELGVDQIVPLCTKRCQISELHREDRLMAIIKEATEQSEKCFLPELTDLISLENYLKNHKSGLLLGSDPWNYDFKLKELDGDTKENITIVIGPEGGLTDEELEMIRKANGRIFLLGETVLRMETAAIAAISLVQFG